MARPLPPLLSITPASMAVAANAMTGGIPLPERDDSWELQPSVLPAGEARWEELQTAVLDGGEVRRSPPSSKKSSADQKGKGSAAAPSMASSPPRSAGSSSPSTPSPDSAGPFKGGHRTSEYIGAMRAEYLWVAASAGRQWAMRSARRALVGSGPLPRPRRQLWSCLDSRRRLRARSPELTE